MTIEQVSVAVAAPTGTVRVVVAGAEAAGKKLPRDDDGVSLSADKILSKSTSPRTPKSSILEKECSLAFGSMSIMDDLPGDGSGLTMAEELLGSCISRLLESLSFNLLRCPLDRDDDLRGERK